MPPEPPPAFAAIRITATTTTIPMAIASHVLRLQPPRRFVPLELSISDLLGLVLRADAPYLSDSHRRDRGFPSRGGRTSPFGQRADGGSAAKVQLGAAEAEPVALEADAQDLVAV